MNPLPTILQTSLAMLVLQSFATAQEPRPNAPHEGTENRVERPSLIAYPPTATRRSPAAQFRLSLSPADAKPGEIVTLRIEATIRDGWHIGPIEAAANETVAFPTTVRFQGVGLEAVGAEFRATPAAALLMVGSEQQMGHETAVVWTRDYRVAKDAKSFSGCGEIRFQACDDSKCLPPNSMPFSFSPAGASIAQVDSLHETNLDGTRPVRPVAAAYKSIGSPTKLALGPSTLERSLIDYTDLITADPSKDMDQYMKQTLKAMQTKEALPLGGTFVVGDQSVSIYLAEQDTYELSNASDDDSNFGNTATFLSIDHDANGIIDKPESVPVNRPVRLLDSMYVVTDIAKGGSSITLQQVDVPLAGAILGRRCPEFWYETVGGQVVSNKSILGKVTILDIWAVT